MYFISHHCSRLELNKDAQNVKCLQLCADDQGPKEASNKTSIGTEPTTRYLYYKRLQWTMDLPRLHIDDQTKELRLIDDIVKAIKANETVYWK